MKIILLSDLDTGFFSATMKKAFIELGHDCVVMQTIKTYLDGEGEHIDYLMGPMTDLSLLEEEFKDADFFILRSLTDITLRLSGILKYVNKNNMIYKVHGSELREKNVPYSMRTWMIDWYGKEPLICGPRDPSLISKYRGNVITHIERPCDFSIFPKKRTAKPAFALHTPTNIERKGTEELIAQADDGRNIPLHILHGVSRAEILKEKSKASYYIDRLGFYEHGPYGMNSVEAWFYKIPVFSKYNDMDVVMCPELPALVYNVLYDSASNAIRCFKYDKKRIEYAYKYAINTHNPIRIAQQYLAVSRAIGTSV